MYIINDIDYLLTLAKLLRVHELLPAGSLAVSRLKMQQHGAIIRQQLATYHQIRHLNVDDLEAFEAWSIGKSRDLSTGDLSTVYIATKNPQLTIVLCKDDLFLPEVCGNCAARSKKWDDLIKEIADKRLIDMYELLKNAS